MDIRSLTISLGEAFPNAPALTPLTVLGEGFGSLVVETAGGTVFRIAKHADAQRGDRRETHVLPVIQSAISGLDVPRVRYFQETSIAFPFGVIGYDKLPGRPLSPDDIDNENRFQVAAQVAEFLVALHGIDGVALQIADLPLFPPAPARMAELWENVAAFLERHFPTSEYRQAQSWLHGLLDYEQRHPYTPTLVHGDFWYENLLFDEERQRLVGVIDFENVSIGDAAIDLATQRYMGDDFAQAVFDIYYQHRVPSDLFERTKDLLGLRELIGLEFGLAMESVDADALGKVRHAILSSHD